MRVFMRGAPVDLGYFQVARARSRTFSMDAAGFAASAALMKRVVELAGFGAAAGVNRA